jgi:hypothetical protein
MSAKNPTRPLFLRLEVQILPVLFDASKTNFAANLRLSRRPYWLPMTQLCDAFLFLVSEIYVYMHRDLIVLERDCHLVKIQHRWFLLKDVLN